MDETQRSLALANNKLYWASKMMIGFRFAEQTNWFRFRINLKAKQGYVLLINYRKYVAPLSALVQGQRGQSHGKND